MTKKTQIIIGISSLVALTGFLLLVKVILSNQVGIGGTFGGGGGSSFSNAPILPVVQGLASATTTVCALPSPSSTSTLMSFALNITTGTSTGGLFTIGTSTTAYSTSSSMFLPSIVVGANTQQTITWVPQSSGVSSSSGVVSPNTFIVAGVQGVPFGYTYGGTCKALFNIL